MLLRGFLFLEALVSQDEGQTVTEELAKVLWYWPPHEALEEQRRHVALALALIGFASGFPANKTRSKPPSVEVVRTLKRVHGFLRCEEGVWMVFTVRRPHSNHNAQRFRLSVPGPLDWVDEAALQAVMIRTYGTFALLHGEVNAALRAPPPLPRGDSALVFKGPEAGGGLLQRAVTRLEVAQQELLVRSEVRRLEEAALQEGDEQHAGVTAAKCRLAALQRLMPLEPLRHALRDFMQGFLPTIDFSCLHSAQDQAGLRMFPLARGLDGEVQRLQQGMQKELSSGFGRVEILAAHGGHLIWAGLSLHEAVLLYSLLCGMRLVADQPSTGMLRAFLNALSPAAGSVDQKREFAPAPSGFVLCKECARVWAPRIHCTRRPPLSGATRAAWRAVCGGDRGGGGGISSTAEEKVRRMVVFVEDAFCIAVLVEEEAFTARTRTRSGADAGAGLGPLVPGEPPADVGGGEKLGGCGCLGGACRGVDAAALTQFCASVATTIRGSLVQLGTQVRAAKSAVPSATRGSLVVHFSTCDLHSSTSAAPRMAAEIAAAAGSASVALDDMHAAFHQSGSSVTEIAVRNDGEKSNIWVVARRGNGREIFAALEAPVQSVADARRALDVDTSA